MKDYSIWGTILGYPNLGKYHIGECYRGYSGEAHMNTFFVVGTPHEGPIILRNSNIACSTAPLFISSA